MKRSGNSFRYGVRLLHQWDRSENDVINGVFSGNTSSRCLFAVIHSFCHPINTLSEDPVKVFFPFCNIAMKYLSLTLSEYDIYFLWPPFQTLLTRCFHLMETKNSFYFMNTLKISLGNWNFSSTFFTLLKWITIYFLWIKYLVVDVRYRYISNMHDLNCRLWAHRLILQILQCLWSAYMSIQNYWLKVSWKNETDMYNINCVCLLNATSIWTYNTFWLILNIIDVFNCQTDS